MDNESKANYELVEIRKQNLPELNRSVIEEVERYQEMRMKEPESRIAAGTYDSMTGKEFRAWLKRLVRRYPEIGSVHLAGSRAYGYQRPDSDYDLIISLENELYDMETGKRKNDTELRIAQANNRPALDIFFLRPNGELHRYNYQDGMYSGEIPIPEEWMSLYISREQAIEDFMDGVLILDFSSLHKSLSDAKELYFREGCLKKLFRVVEFIYPLVVDRFFYLSKLP